MGHMLVYTIGDVVTRFRARNGMHVLHPQGFDSFGLPAENAAIKEGGHPREIVERNIAHIKRSMRRAGWAYDWSRELSTHDPEYIRWQQWQFLRFLERGLAYRKGAPVKWCPNDQTVLANEQVHDGRCERCGAEVESRLMEQWFFRDHRLRAGAARRPRDGRLARVDQGTPAATGSGARTAPRSSSGSRSWTRTSPSSRPGPTRSTARRSSCSRPSTSSSRGSTPTRCASTCAAPRRRRPRSAPRPRRRRASSPGCTRSTP